jgi:hypothetical protein
MPTRRIDATENFDTSGKAGTSKSRNGARVPIHPDNAGMKNSRNTGKSQNTGKSESRPVWKTPKSRNFRPVRKHRKFDSSGRYPETLTSAPTRKRTEPDEQTRPTTTTKESRRPMQNRTPDRMTGEKTQEAKPEPEGAMANAVKAWSEEGPELKSRRA